MEELQYFKRSFCLWESCSTIPSACSYSSTSDSLHFSIFLTPRSLILFKEWQSIFLFFFLLYCYIFLLSTPWDPEWKNPHSLSLCSGPTPVSWIYTRYLTYCTQHPGLGGILISTGQMGNEGSGSWGPDQLKGRQLDLQHVAELVHTHMAAGSPGGWMPLHQLSSGHGPLCAADAWGSLQCLLLAKPCTWLGFPHGRPVGSFLPQHSTQWGNWVPERESWPTQSSTSGNGKRMILRSLSSVSNMHFLKSNSQRPTVTRNEEVNNWLVHKTVIYKTFLKQTFSIKWGNKYLRLR